MTLKEWRMEAAKIVGRVRLAEDENIPKAAQNEDAKSYQLGGFLSLRFNDGRNIYDELAVLRAVGFGEIGDFSAQQPSDGQTGRYAAEDREFEEEFIQTGLASHSKYRKQYGFTKKQQKRLKELTPKF